VFRKLLKLDVLVIKDIIQAYSKTAWHCWVPGQSTKPCNSPRKCIRALSTLLMLCLDSVTPSFVSMLQISSILFTIYVPYLLNRLVEKQCHDFCELIVQIGAQYLARSKATTQHFSSNHHNTIISPYQSQNNLPEFFCTMRPDR